jgi:hypothetical protein
MREKGYYWVKLNAEWIVALFEQLGYWYIPGSESIFLDYNFDEIDEIRILR